jgi:hypothetical protein
MNPGRSRARAGAEPDTGVTGSENSNCCLPPTEYAEPTIIHSSGFWSWSCDHLSCQSQYSNPLCQRQGLRQRQKPKMHPSHISIFISVLLVLIAFAPLQALAFPWSSRHSNAGDCLDTTPPFSNLKPYGQDNLPQLRWLRDTFVQKIFGVSKPYPPQSSTFNALPPFTLSVKHSGDVVLRFNLSTPQEEEMLAEAADTLFLDVWEFTNNWADIRLREDEVIAISFHSSGLANNGYNRYPRCFNCFPSPSRQHTQISCRI